MLQNAFHNGPGNQSFLWKERSWIFPLKVFSSRQDCLDPYVVPIRSHKILEVILRPGPGGSCTDLIWRFCFLWKSFIKQWPPPLTAFMKSLFRILTVFWVHMTQFKIEVMSLCKGVSKILTAYRIFLIFFSFYHHKEEIRSFPTMYNT